MWFILQTARRELRSAGKRLLFFFLCIAIGVAAIVSLRSILGNINSAVSGEARELLTADVQIDTDRPWSKETLAAIDKIAQPPLVISRTATVESATMLRPDDLQKQTALMIELKGIEPGFPLVGDFRLQDGTPFNYQLLKDYGAIVSVTLLERLQLKVGDLVKIGDNHFQIRAAFQNEVGDAGAFRIGPRIFVTKEALDSAGLSGFLTRARRKLLFVTEDGKADLFAERVKQEIKDSTINIRTYRETQETLSDRLSRAEDYLSLAGLVVLVLGGIGISNVTRVFIEQKKRSIAVLKCLGANSWRIIAAYLLQVMALGIIGSLLGILLAKFILMIVAYYFADQLPANVSYQLLFSAVIQGIAVGVLISILFSALPLLKIRQIKPNMLLRDEKESKLKIDPLRYLTAIFTGAALITVIGWQAGSLRIGFYFFIGLAITAMILQLAAILLMWLMRHIKKIRSFSLRHAIHNLYRPGNQTRVIITVIGLGVFLVLSIQSLQENLLEDLDFNKRGRLANMYLIDVQEDQVSGVSEITRNYVKQEPTLVPTVRLRVAAINGTEVDFNAGPIRRERGMLGREYVATYRDHLEANEKVSAGTFWPPTPSEVPEVSVDESLRGVADIKVGTDITFDIQGRKITAKVSNIRRIDWRNSRTGFIFLFRPGVLERAPKSFVAAINAPLEETARGRFQREVLDRYPNITLIDVTEIMRRISKILNNVTLAIAFIGGFVFLSGILILIGSIAITKYQRIYETALLKTLGAVRRKLLATIIIEFLLLGLLSGIIGALTANGLSYLITHRVFKIAWQFFPMLNFWTLSITMLLVTAVGAISTFNVLVRKPWPILRGQQ